MTPGTRVRLTRRIGFHPAGTEATVVELSESLLNGFDLAVRLGDGKFDVLCVDVDDVEELDDEPAEPSDEDIAEGKLMARDYEAWANL